MIRKVPYFSKLDPILMVKIMYSLKQQRYETSEMIFTEGDNVECIYFIIEGEIEIYKTVYDKRALTILNSKNFKKYRRRDTKLLTTINYSKSRPSKMSLFLGILNMGSCIFPKLFLSKGEVLISARAISNAHVLMMTRTMLQDLCNAHPELDEAVKQYHEGLIYFDTVRNEVLPKVIPIDIIKNHKYSNGVNKTIWNLMLKFKR